MPRPMPIAGDDWYEIIRLSDGVSLIRERYVADWLRCNIWHVQGRNRDLLIDSGLGLRPLKPEIARLTDKPVTAVMSHCHFDHIGAGHEFSERLGHPACQSIYLDPLPDEMPFKAFIRAETFIALPDRHFSIESFSITPAPLTDYLDEGDLIDLGDRTFRVLHLPGHSPDSIALFEDETRILFSGDVVYDGDLLDTLYHSDPELYRESLARLKTLPVQIVHGGHDESFGRQRMIEIIDDYFAGRGRILDPYEWVGDRL